MRPSRRAPDQLRPVSLGNLSEVGDLAVAASDIEDRQALKTHLGVAFRRGSDGRGAAVEMLVALIFPGHVRSLSVRSTVPES